MKLVFLKKEENLAKYGFEAVFMALLLVANQGN